MYIVSLTYHRPIAEVDSHLDGHIARLKTYFQDGTFIASGRKIPHRRRDPAKGIDRARLDAIPPKIPSTPWLTTRSPTLAPPPPPPVSRRWPDYKTL